MVHANSSGWWFGTFCIFPYIGNNNLNWLSYFSEGLKPPASHVCAMHWCYTCLMFGVEGAEGATYPENQTKNLPPILMPQSFNRTLCISLLTSAMALIPVYPATLQAVLALVFAIDRSVIELDRCLSATGPGRWPWNSARCCSPHDPCHQPFMPDHRCNQNPSAVGAGEAAMCSPFAFSNTQPTSWLGPRLQLIDPENLVSRPSLMQIQIYNIMYVICIYIYLYTHIWKCIIYIYTYWIY